MSGRPGGAAPAEDDYVLVGVRPYGEAQVDVHVVGGRIAQIRMDADGVGEHRAAAGQDATYVRDFDGLVLLPGLVDMHTHLREPGGEESETVASGARAAASGGYTDVFAMANTDPVTDSVTRVAHVRDIAARDSIVRVHPVSAITVGLADAELVDFQGLASAGVTVFSDDGHCVSSSALMYRALEFAAELQVTVAQHAQDPSLAGTGQVNAGTAAKRIGLEPWPAVGETSIIARDVALAAATGGHLHVCHVSTKSAVEVVRWAKASGWPVTAEATPHHLFLSDETTSGCDTRYKVNPPLRTHDDVVAIRQAVLDGTIDIVATDHAPHAAAKKAQPWPRAPFGMIGLESSLRVVVTALWPDGPIDWHLVAQIMSHRPASIGGIASIAGRPISVGEPADFAIIDPEPVAAFDVSDIQSRSQNSPFLGSPVRGRVIATFLAGALVWGGQMTTP